MSSHAIGNTRRRSARPRPGDELALLREAERAPRASSRQRSSSACPPRGSSSGWRAEPVTTSRRSPSVRDSRRSSSRAPSRPPPWRRHAQALWLSRSSAVRSVAMLSWRSRENSMPLFFHAHLGEREPEELASPTATLLRDRCARGRAPGRRRRQCSTATSRGEERRRGISSELERNREREGTNRGGEAVSLQREPGSRDHEHVDEVKQPDEADRAPSTRRSTSSPPTRS